MSLIKLFTFSLKLTFRAPISITVLPRQLIEDAHKRNSHVVNGPGYDKVVVQHYNAGDYYHPIA